MLAISTLACGGGSTAGHYFSLGARFDPATLLISSPVDGTVRALDPESNGFGFQLNIQPTVQPAFRLVSWFDVITEAVFQEYRAKGVVARDDMIISLAARDADPLTCNGEAFTTFGTLPSWVALR